MSLKTIYEQKTKDKPHTTQSNEQTALLLLQKQTNALQKANSIIQEQNSTIQKLRQQVQQLTEQNVMLSESDLQLKHAEELKKNVDEQKKENEKENERLKNEKAWISTAKKELEQREDIIKNREINQNQHDLDVQAQADKRIEANKVKANQAYEDKIEDFTKKHWVIFAIVSVMCAMQMIGNVVFGVDNRLIAESFQSLYTTATASNGYMVLWGIIVVLWIIQIFRFFDKMTLLALLVDIALIEYGAKYFVEQGHTLWIVFAVIQGIYIAIRDITSEKSIIRELLDGLSSSKY